jgi:hypothetical protein
MSDESGGTEDKVVGGFFGAWCARITVESEVGKRGASPSPPSRMQAHYKLLKKSSLRVFDCGCRPGHLTTRQAFGRNRKLLGNLARGAVRSRGGALQRYELHLSKEERQEICGASGE